MVTGDRRTFSVFLSLEREAKFPERCVACGAVPATKKIEAEVQTNWLLQIVPLMSRRNRRIKVEAPACAKCAKSAWWSIGLRDVTVIFLVIAVFALCVFAAQYFDFSARIAKYVPRRMAKKIGILMAAVLASPLIYWIYTRFPTVPFEIEIEEGKVEYVFRDREYWRDFEKLNSSL